MDATSVKLLLISATLDFGEALLLIVGACLAIGVGMLIIRAGINLVWHADGTTNALGRHWSWWDQHTYSPYKGYKRWRSRKWNLEHMPDGM